jgi:hypothetical protein
MTYSQSISLGRQRYARANRNSVSFASNGRTIGPISNTIILIVLACLLGLLYLTQVTKTNAYGYRINELQTKASALRAERDELEIASARLQSLDRVGQSGVAKSLVSAAPAATLR